MQFATIDIIRADAAIVLIEFSGVSLQLDSRGDLNEDLLLAAAARCEACCDECAEQNHLPFLHDSTFRRRILANMSSYASRPCCLGRLT